MEKQIIRIISPGNFLAERTYIYSYLIEDRLGLRIALEPRFNDGTNLVSLILPNGEKVEFPDIFFQNVEKSWLDEKSLPKAPLKTLDFSNTQFEELLTDPFLPVLFGLGGNTFFQPDGSFTIDLFGSCFFLLTGYEEYIVKEKNQFGNFPFEASIACKGGFVKRPLVNEYLEILWALLKTKDPSLYRKAEKYNFIPTHDVDHPFMYYFNDFWGHLKGSLGDIIKSKNPRQFVNRNLSWMFRAKGDPYNTFSWIMNLSEKKNLKSVFFLKNCKLSNRFDNGYDIRKPAMKNLILDIHRRGHQIGFHPSYYTHNDKQLFESEIRDFRSYVGDLGIKQDINQVRQHYLRYEVPATTEIHEHYKLAFDYSLGYYNVSGFRRGTSHSFPVFNILRREVSEVIGIPLTLMEISLPLEYSDPAQRFDAAKDLISVCKKYKGNFVLLWHNSNLLFEEERELYKNILSHS